MGALLWLSHTDLMRTQQELVALRASNADLKQASDQVAATVKDLAAAVAASAAAQKGDAVSRRARAGDAAVRGRCGTREGGERGEGGARADGGARNAAGVSRSEPVPYGELPFDHSRVDVLRDILSKLEAQGFRGVVKVTSSPGSSVSRAMPRTDSCRPRPICR